jgi:hypothetical protein
MINAVFTGSIIQVYGSTEEDNKTTERAKEKQFTRFFDLKNSTGKGDKPSNKPDPGKYRTGRSNWVLLPKTHASHRARD